MAKKTDVLYTGPTTFNECLTATGAIDQQKMRLFDAYRQEMRDKERAAFAGLKKRVGRNLTEGRVVGGGALLLATGKIFWDWWTGDKPANS